MSLPFRRAVAGRTGLRRNGSAAAPASLRPISNTAAVKSAEAKETQQPAAVSYEEMRYGNPLSLPRLPIPTLEDTVSRYLQSVEPLARGRPDDLARAGAVANRFLEKDGPILHSMVVEKDAARKGYPYSYIEELWDDMYLEGRWSLPINSNPYLALKPPPKDTVAPGGSDAQIMGATRFMSSFLKWHRRVRDGTFQPDASRPGCVRGYALQGGSARVPRKGRDRVQHFPASRHAVVFCNNRIFRINLLGGEDGESQISEEDLRKAFEAIRASAFSEPYGPSPGEAFVGHLTSKGRDDWAVARAALKGFSPVNKATLFEIDSALLAIALDDHGIPDLQTECRAFLTGDSGRNRWFDKHQLVVLKCGKMAVNFEHSFSDGMDWTRMLSEIWHDMYGVKAKGVLTFPKAPLLASPPPPPRELLWKLPYELKRDVVCARKEFDEACEGYTLDAVEFRDFGKNSCKEWKMSPDAVAQMAFQLAFKRLHGTIPSVYESCTTRWFHHGRTETIRSCTTESANFVSVMDSDSKGKETRRAVLDAAAAKHIQVAKAAAQGQGVDRHLYAMRAAATAAAEAEGGSGGGGEVEMGQEFFGDPLVAETSAWRLSTSNVSMPFLSSFGFGAVAADGYGLGYNIDGDVITIPVTAFRVGDTDGKLMAKELERALREIGDVCR